MKPRKCVCCKMQAECCAVPWAYEVQICRECTTVLVGQWAQLRKFEIEAFRAEKGER